MKYYFLRFRQVIHIKRFTDTSQNQFFSEYKTHQRRHSENAGRVSGTSFGPPASTVTVLEQPHSRHSKCRHKKDVRYAEITISLRADQWKQDVCGDVAPNLMARVAKNSGALIPGEGNHLQKYMRFPDYHKPTRAYAIRADKLE